MEITKEIKEEIENLYKDDPDYAIKLLSCDAQAIQDLSFDNNITPDEVIYAYEKNKVDELYEEAKFRQRRKELYFKLINGNNIKNNVKVKSTKKTN